MRYPKNRKRPTPKYRIATSEYPLYRAWNAMIQRCKNPNQAHYSRYGGRGITVCDRWAKSFANFLIDMGERPDGMQLDRINNDGPYSPDNCRWVSLEDQANNKRDNKLIEYAGLQMTYRQWEGILGLTAGRIHARIKAGWPQDRAVNYAVPVADLEARIRAKG